MFSNAGFSVAPFASTSGQTVNVAITDTTQVSSTAVPKTVNNVAVTNTVQATSTPDPKVINNTEVNNTVTLAGVLDIQANLHTYIYTNTLVNDSNIASKTTTNSVSETVTENANLGGSFLFIASTQTYTNAVEGIGCTKEQNGFLSEANSISYNTSASGNFYSSITENFSLGDTYLSNGVFNPSVNNFIGASVIFTAGLNIANLPIVEGVSGYSVFYGEYLWNLVDDSQTAVWAAITTPVGNWTIINDANSPNWVNIETT